ncbi:MAG: primase protein [Candidatus Peregrinibacteria bacterium GW2011_GWA2_47_7]|nr:MAG: primase protein [Candidatus Peregrinibacteria bacterium GW2011_GWA2_47_7]
MDTVEEIKSRLDIAELVGSYLPLKKAGKNFKGLCPFHQEKTPSFIVSPDKQLAYCFGCHRGGDIFRFVQEVEGIDFVSALKLLAERVGVAVPEKFHVKGLPPDTRERLYQIHTVASAYFEKQLWETKGGEKVLSYLRKERKIKDDTIKNFHIGYAPDDKNGLAHELLHAGYERQDIVTSGLCISTDTTSREIIDRFRGRVLFPITNPAGMICAFGARALSPEQEPKYLNSPETPLYHKEQVLYGLSEAKMSIRQQHMAVIMEGYMDVIQAHQAGITNAVAMSGTALSRSHLQLLRRFTDTVVFFFDNDRAGIEAFKRSLPLAQSFDMNVKVLMAKEGKDPDEWIRKDPSAVISALEDAPGYMDFYFTEMRKNKEQIASTASERGRLHSRAISGNGGGDASPYIDMSEIKDEKKFLEEVLPVIARVVNAFERDRYLQKLSSLLHVASDVLYTEMRRQEGKVSPRFSTEESSHKMEIPKKPPFSIAEYLFGFIINNPDYFESVRQKIGEDDLPSPVKDVYKAFSDFYNLGHENGVDVVEVVLSRLSDTVKERAKIWSLYIEAELSGLPQEALDREFEAVLQKFIHTGVEGRKRNLLREMKVAEEQGDRKKAESIFSQYHILISEPYGKKT